jgi:hypothetical protein
MKFSVLLVVLAMVPAWAGKNGDKSSDKSGAKTAVKTATQPASKVFFKNLKDGQTVPLKFKVEFGVEGMKLRPAGEDVNDKTSGHHHLIINGGPVKEGEVIPADETHLHFGKAQTEAEIDLKKPGWYTLTLQLADGAHRSYGEHYSTSIRVQAK